MGLKKFHSCKQFRFHRSRFWTQFWSHCFHNNQIRFQPNQFWIQFRCFHINRSRTWNRNQSSIPILESDSPQVWPSVSMIFVKSFFFVVFLWVFVVFYLCFSLSLFAIVVWSEGGHVDGGQWPFLSRIMCDDKWSLPFWRQRPHLSPCPPRCYDGCWYAGFFHVTSGSVTVPIMQSVWPG